MKLYVCTNCSNPLYFENSFCLNCKHPVGFDATSMEMITLEPGTANTYENIRKREEKYLFCANSVYGTCNWLIPATPGTGFCRACELNRVIPELSVGKNLQRWKQIEIAKHRLIYSLLKLRLPVKAKLDPEDEGIVFDFLQDISPDEKVITGHDNGTITLNIDEADEAERVRHKNDLGERYRTLLGHFRHEVGHYYWDVIMKDQQLLQSFRQLFGDEQQDYALALEAYYANGPKINWNLNYISPYATAHPWEDWAETWAHYLHMMDTLETSYAFGVTVNPVKVDDKLMHLDSARDPYTVKDFKEVVDAWMPLSFALNSLNRSMGHQDFYPFFTPPPVIQKLRFIHELLANHTFGSVAGSQMPAAQEPQAVPANANGIVVDAGVPA